MARVIKPRSHCGNRARHSPVQQRLKRGGLGRTTVDDTVKAISRRMQKGDPEYNAWVKGLGDRYQRSQIRASVSVNTAMLAFYWSLGRDIVGMDAENRYGSGFYETLSRDPCEIIPNRKGLSPRNLRYMRRFYQLFPSEQNMPQLVAGFEGQSGMENLPQPVADSSDAVPTSRSRWSWRARPTSPARRGGRRGRHARRRGRRSPGRGAAACRRPRWP